MEELSSGPCVAMEIVAKDSSHNTAVEFRKLVGPSDPVSSIPILIEFSKDACKNSLRIVFIRFY